MKNLIYTCCVAIVLAGLFGCKKGEDDPFLSLKSRKSRLTGEWKVSQMTSKEAEQNTFFLTSSGTNSTYDGTTLTTTEEHGGVSETYSSNFSQEFTFEKDGTYKMVITETEDGESYTETTEGNWIFLGKNKNADLKNKEAISLSQTKFSTSDGEFESSGGSFQNYNTLIISQLKNKELVFSFDEEQTINTTHWTREGTMTLTKK